MIALKKHLLSFFVVVIFLALAAGSKVNKIHTGAFNQYVSVEDRSDGNYILKNDGTKLYGDNIRWRSGLILNDVITIDGQKFKIADVQGYREGDYFYGRQKNEYIKRIVHGKINVYIRIEERMEQATGSNIRVPVTHSFHYAQKGDFGPMIPLGSQKDIKAVVSDCPAAYAMADLKSSKIRKAIRANRNYLNEIFETYNNDCKPVKSKYSNR